MAAKFCFSCDNSLQSEGDEFSLFTPIPCWAFSYEIIRNVTYVSTDSVFLKVWKGSHVHRNRKDLRQVLNLAGDSSFKATHVASSSFGDEQCLPSVKCCGEMVAGTVLVGGLE